MFNLFFGSPAWQLIIQSDWMTKFILISLFVLSVACIAIISFKFRNLRQQKQAMANLFGNIRKSKTFAQLLEIGKKHQNSIGGTFLTQNLNELKNLLDKNNEQKLTMQDFETLEICAAQTIDRLLMEADTFLPILGISAAVAPFVGLFGTIWGLIHSFVSISQEKSADISVVAPGIAEALTTTLAGLLVAIPAMIAFHYFSNELRKLEQPLDHLSDKFLVIVRQTFVK